MNNGDSMKESLTTQQFNHEVKRVQWLGRLLNYWSLKQHYLTYLNVHAWEIFEIDYGMNVGHEFGGRHYGVVLYDSFYNNPIITVIPIKTAKGKLNPHSDVFLGKIEGIQSLSSSIAVVNQIQSIDKLRIFNVDSINQKEYPKKSIFLNGEQIRILKESIFKILFNYKN